MAQERIEIHFKPTGDKALVRAIKELDVATKRLKGQVSVYEKELKQATKAQKKHSNAILLGTRNMRNMGKGVSKLGVKLSVLRSKLLIISFTVALVSKAISVLTGKFAEQEKAEKILSVAYGKNITNLKNYASGLQEITVFGDEAILGAQSLLAAFIKDEEQLKRATVATLDLASAKGLDLKTAADLVGKSFGSSTNALSRYGINVDHAVGSSARLNAITQNIAKLYSGQATAAVDTLSGSMAQMTNAFGDASEALGALFAPMLTDFAKKIKGAAEGAREFLLVFKEDELETIARKIEVMGGNADKFRLSIAKTKEIELSSEINKAGTGLKTIVDLQKEVKDAKDEELRLYMKMGDEASTLGNIEKLREQEGRGYLEMIAEAHSRNLAQEQKNFKGVKLTSDELLKQVRLEQKNATIKLEQLDSLIAQKEENDKILKTSQDNLKLATEYQAALLEIETLNAKIAGKPLAPDLPEKFNEKIIAFFKDTMVTIEGEMGSIQVNLFHMVDEVLQHSKELLGEWGNQATETANESISAIDAVMNKDIENLKKSRSFHKMSAKKQADEEKKIRDKAEADKAEARKKANRIKLHEFRIDQLLNIKKAIINTAEEVSKHVGNPWMAAFTYAAGAAQVALIAAQKPPKMARGGFVGGRRHSEGGTLIEAEQGEFVMSRNAVNTIGAENLNRMNRGGGGAINVNFTGNVLSSDFIENDAIPQIKEAIRRGADIGVS